MNRILAFIAGFAAGALPVYLIYRNSVKKLSGGIIRKAKDEAAGISQKASSAAKEIYRKKEEDLNRSVGDKESDLSKRIDKIKREEEEIKKSGAEMEAQQRELTNQRENYERKNKMLHLKEEEVFKKVSQQQASLERVSHLTPEDAKKILISSMEDAAREDAKKLMADLIKQAENDAEIKAKKIIATAIQQAGTEELQSLTATVIQIKNDDMKGRIIGKEGRNIKAFEAATGVELIVDDTPGIITLSSFDGVRRYIGQLTVEKLLADGRIHPGRIEELAAKAKTEVDKHIKDVGRQTAEDLGVAGLKDNMLEMLGRMEFRFSYGQNILRHSIEVSKIAKAIAHEIGVNAEFAARAGLLHDIGKALPGELDGSHAIFGAEFLEKNGEKAKLVNAVKAHHEEVPFETIEAVLIAVGDALSASRPGARMESVDHYFKRIKKIEEIAMMFDGVERAYAISAGREVRVIVKPERITESNAPILAREIAKKISQEVEYPGQLKVALIREQRWNELA